MRKIPKKRAVIAIVGPTSSGKTSLSIRLAGMLSGEVISADSRQVYRGLDLISGKVTKKEAGGIPHHLLDVADPKKVYSASLYVERAGKALEDILTRGRIPIVVGGTGFYIDTLLRGLSLPEVPPNTKLRKKMAQKTASELFLILKKLDPRRARTIERKNPARLIRAIEIATALGSVPKLKRQKVPYFVLWLGLKPSDQLLEQNIRTRIRERLVSGMVREAKRLHAQGLPFRRMRELGLELGHLADLLEKKIDSKTFEEGLTRDSVRYAKRQMRWFKRAKDIHWFASGRDKKIDRLIKRFLK